MTFVVFQLQKEIAESNIQTSKEKHIKRFDLKNKQEVFGFGTNELSNYEVGW